MRLFGKKIAPVAPPMNRDVPAKCLRRIFFGCAMSASPHGNGFAREDGRGREPSARGSRLRVFLFLGPVSAGGETGKAGPFLQRVQGSPAALPRRRRRWAPSFRRRSVGYGTGDAKPLGAGDTSVGYGKPARLSGGLCLTIIQKIDHNPRHKPFKWVLYCMVASLTTIR